MRAADEISDEDRAELNRVKAELDARRTVGAVSNRLRLTDSQVVTAADYAAWVNAVILEFGGEPLDPERFSVEGGVMYYELTDPPPPPTKEQRISYEVLDLTKVRPKDQGKRP
jgi:hypothetical protein